MNWKNYIFGILLFLMVSACQKEEATIVTNPTENLNTDPSLVDLIEQIAQNPTDNDELDDSKCYKVILPVKVILNKEVIEIKSKGDLNKISESMNKDEDDDDLINFLFPITIEFKDYKSQVINSKEELKKIKDNCPKEDNDKDDKIDCIKINYPITINMYDSENQKAKTIIINDNASLYSYLNNLDSKIFISINYPISFIDADGKNVTVENNSQFDKILLQNFDKCKKSKDSE